MLNDAILFVWKDKHTIIIICLIRLLEIMNIIKFQYEKNIFIIIYLIENIKSVICTSKIKNGVFTYDFQQLNC